MIIPNSNIRFFYKNGLFVSVKLPIGSKPIVYMNCGTDNRPYRDIVDDINIAFELLYKEEPHGFIQDMCIADKLPKLLGYHKSNARLK